MKYCRECGEKNSDDSSFCTKCGTQFALLKETGSAIVEHKVITEQPRVAPLVRRNFLLWWALSFVASPLYFVYIYFNFEDMNNLEERDVAKEGPSMKMEKDNIIMYMILSFIIPFVGIVVRYWKYDKFHKYLEYNYEKNQTMPISGKKYVWLTVIMILMLTIGSVLLNLLPLPFIFTSGLMLGLFIGISVLTLIVGMGISFYLIYIEHIWQKAMNERILMIDPNAEEKSLF